MSEQKRLLQLLEEVKTALKEEKVHQSKKRTTGNSYSSDLGLGGIIDDKRARLIKTIIEKTDNALDAFREEMFSVVLRAKPPTKKRFILNALCASVDPESEDWILTRIVNYTPSANTVEVRDEDDKDKKLYKLKEEQVLPLGSGKVPHLKDFSPGDAVLALYPHTTTFYRAEVVKHNSTTEILEVRFDGDDMDENGQLVIKEVPVYFIADKLT